MTLKITFDEALQIIVKAMPPPARGIGEDFYRTLHIREGFIEAQGALIAEWQKSLAAMDKQSDDELVTLFPVRV